MEYRIFQGGGDQLWFRRSLIVYALPPRMSPVSLLRAVILGAVFRSALVEIGRVAGTLRSRQRPQGCVQVSARSGSMISFARASGGAACVSLGKSIVPVWKSGGHGHGFAILVCRSFGLKIDGVTSLAFHRPRLQLPGIVATAARDEDRGRLSRPSQMSSEPRDHSSESRDAHSHLQFWEGGARWSVWRWSNNSEVMLRTIHVLGIVITRWR